MLTLDLTHPLAEELLAQALKSNPERLDLAALAIAALEFPALDPEPTLDALERLARRVSRRLPENASASAQLDALREVLVDEEGFTGDLSRYGEAEMSFLNCVVDRKVGLPITLSVVWIEVARRAGIPLYGVGFPGHFLCALDAPEGTLFVDPFGKGRLLTPEELQALLHRTVPGAQVTPQLLQPAPLVAIVWRMLSNLKRLYLSHQDPARALKVEDLLLQLAPDHPSELRARAALRSSLGAYRAALDDLEKCLALGPAKDAPALEAAARALRERLQFLH